MGSLQFEMQPLDVTVSSSNLQIFLSSFLPPFLLLEIVYFIPLCGTIHSNSNHPTGTKFVLFSLFPQTKTAVWGTQLTQRSLLGAE